MKNIMPDIACKPFNKQNDKTINWVGMSNIEIPMLIPSADVNLIISSKVQAYVDLKDAKAKGIHMSRLYLILDEFATSKPISPKHLKDILELFINSHKNISNNAMVEFSFNYYERRNSLKSKNKGWKHYPVKVNGVLKNNIFECDLSITVPYSSTCPCSAALSRQLIQQSLAEEFKNKDLYYEDIYKWLGTSKGISATPHSQRSYAQVKIKVDNNDEFNISNLIKVIEDSLKTPVQSTVKREDEQEFAKLNASNLMFCEDAIRRLQNSLSYCMDYWIRVNHIESLHPHNAIAIATKGIKDGYKDYPELMYL